MKTANKSNIKQGVVAKIVLSFVLLFLTGLGSLIYFVNRTNDLTIYPNLNGKEVEMYIKSDKATISIINKLIEEKKPTVDVIIKISQKRKITKNFQMKDFNFTQEKCHTKWECPVYTMPKEKFYKEILKK